MVRSFVILPSHSDLACAQGIVSAQSPVSRAGAPWQVSRRSSTALRMNLADRFLRVAKANLNNILQTWEDPEKVCTTPYLVNHAVQISEYCCRNIEELFSRLGENT